MPKNDYYEQFRNILTMNLCKFLNTDDLSNVLKTIDITLNDYEISKKQMDIITNQEIPEVVKMYIASKVIANISKGTVKQYKMKLISFFNDIRKTYMDVNSNDIRMYLYNFKAKRNVSDNYVDNIRRVLNGFFSWLVDNQYLQYNPCANVEKIHYQVKKREPLTSYELELFRYGTESIREKALVDFLFSTGVRISECANVKLLDINWDNRSVIIRKGKGNKRRTVYFNAESELSLRQYLMKRKGESNGLFISMRHPYNALSIGGLQGIIKNISLRTGLHVYPHKLRHTFATQGIRGGMQLEKLQALLGHEKPETTMIYVKIYEEDLQREHERIYA